MINLQVKIIIIIVIKYKILNLIYRLFVILVNLLCNK